MIESAAPQHLVLYLSAVTWDSVEGTDHRLVEHLCREMDVLWVDPTRPFRPHRVRREALMGVSGLSRLGERLWRLATQGLPGVTRPVARDIARWRLPRLVSRAQRVLGHPSAVALLANPSVPCRALDVRRRVFLVTDDFIAGTDLMGLTKAGVERVGLQNLVDADVVLAVSPVLVERLQPLARDVRLLPNGCSPERFWPRGPGAPEVNLRPPVAGVVGQFNERIDLDVMSKVADAGISLLLVGPSVLRDQAQKRRLDALASRPNVQWVGAQPYHRVPEFTAAMDLGLTPYTDTQFNRSSFPLKTLEYLSAGLPVVSTDLPSTRWLHTPLIDVAGPSHFVGAVLARLRDPDAHGTQEERREFASRHSWAARATQLRDIMNEDIKVGGSGSSPTVVHSRRLGDRSHPSR